MAIRCPNDGCEWTGELRNKKVKLAHISINVNKQLYQHKLLFSSVEITKPQTPLKFLHVEAKAVGLIIFVLVLFVEQIHLESCPFQQVGCANKNCHEKAQRRHLTQHKNNVCPWRILQCTYCTEPHPDCMMQLRIVIMEESTRNNTPLARKSFNVSVGKIETLKIE